MRALRVAGLAIVLGANVSCRDILLGPEPNADNVALFNQVWGDFDKHYSFFEYKRVNWTAVGDRYRSRAAAAPTDTALAAVLGEMFNELADIHVAITPGTAPTMRFISVADTVATHFTVKTVFDNYVTKTAYTSGRQMRFGYAAPAIGYIRIADFNGSGWADETDSVLTALGDARAMIIDLRNNPGGSVELAIKVAGRFTGNTRTYGYIKRRNGPSHGDFTDFIEEQVKPVGKNRFTGPVFVLTNRRNFSAAEDFVLAMRSLTHVSIVGDTTGGASGGPVVRELQNGWTYQLSEWIEFTETKQMWEGIGLAPNVVVKATASDMDRGVDPALERALELAKAKIGAP